MDWLEAKFKALEIEAELEALKKNPHQHSHTRNYQNTSSHARNHQNTSSHARNHQTASENHEQNKTSSHHQINHYLKVLDLQPGASQKDIKQAYKDLVLVWHPDRFPNSPRLQKIAEEKIKEINTAYNNLNSKK